MILMLGCWNIYINMYMVGPDFLNSITVSLLFSSVFQTSFRPTLSWLSLINYIYLKQVKKQIKVKIFPDICFLSLL